MKHVLLMSFLLRQTYEPECHVSKGKSTSLNVMSVVIQLAKPWHIHHQRDKETVSSPMQYHIAKGKVKRGEDLGKIMEYVCITLNWTKHTLRVRHITL